ncbi:YndM family protein [Aquibacillus kalidii]|uniref:YndM family protein n=1 Tax=Aquibacillus kalidii TaxID=2762597 RepID=UPI0016477955|nr:YndM family protein [Aquibacillus kalidii]
MKHGKALLIKFVATLALLYIILDLMYAMTFGEVFALTAVLGIVAYLVGDMFVLPRTNNTIATLADFGLAWLIIYLFADGTTIADNPFTISLIGAIGVAAFEMFFHRYLANNTLPDEKQSPATRNLQYQTETSEELLAIVSDNEKKKDE